MNLPSITFTESNRFVLEGVRKEISISDLCSRGNIHPHIYNKLLKDFLEADKNSHRGESLLKEGETED